MQNNEQNGNQNQPVGLGERRVARPRTILNQDNSSVFDRRYRELQADNPQNNGGVDRQSNQGVSVQQVGEGGGYQNPNSETATAEDGRNVRPRIEEAQVSPLDFSAVREGSPNSASVNPTGAGAGAGGGVTPTGAGAGAGGGVTPTGAVAGAGAGGNSTPRGSVYDFPPAHREARIDSVPRDQIAQPPSNSASVASSPAASSLGSQPPSPQI